MDIITGDKIDISRAAIKRAQKDDELRATKLRKFLDRRMDREQCISKFKDYFEKEVLELPENNSLKMRVEELIKKYPRSWKAGGFAKTALEVVMDSEPIRFRDLHRAHEDEQTKDIEKFTLKDMLWEVDQDSIRDIQELT